MSAPTIFIKAAKVIDPRSPFHQKLVDLIIENSIIQEIGESLEIPAQATLFEAKNLHVSLGWMDLRANFNDPGNEDREDLASGAQAAARGGFTSVVLSPDTMPCLDNKTSIQYILKHNSELPVKLLPMGAFSKELKAEELSEIYDMKQSGAVAFSHGNKAVANSALMKLALLYNREIGPSLQVLSQDIGIRSNGQMHEGAKSTWLGLKGIPSLSESMAISRDLALAEYCKAPIHFQGISAKESVALIEEALQKGQAVSADVNLMNLIFSDEDLETYDTNLKVYPPLREKVDQKHLIEALKKGSIKAITSNHQPRTIEEKRCEFDIAYFGAATIEGFFGSLNAKWGAELGLSKIVELISHGPRDIIDYQKDLCIEKGAKAELTLFDPDFEFEWDAKQCQSKAANYPFAGQTLKGKALAIYQNEQLTTLA